MTDTSVRPAEAPTPPEPRGDVMGFDWKLALLLSGIVALGIFGGKGWLLIITALVVMIFLHELGHYLTAKWSGMKVTEFFLFFGPKIWSFKRGETEYGIKCIPLGAYVRIIGMSNLETDVAPEEEHRTFRQQSYPKRLLVVSAGSLMHLLQALVLFFVVFSVLGVSGDSGLGERLGADPKEWRVGDVTPGSAAEEAGLRRGDDLLSINGSALQTFDDVGELVGPHPGDPVDLVVERDGERLELEATLGQREDDPRKGFLGINGPLPSVRANPLEGAAESVRLTGEVMGRTVQGLGAFFTGGVDDFAADVAQGGATSGETSAVERGVGGGRVPTEDDDHRLMSILGIARIGAGASEEGMVDLLLLMAGVNISIGILNMLPLLPLDGGHVVIATYERIRSIGRRRYMADVSRLLPFTYAVFMFFVLLGVSSIYLDIVDPVG